MPYVATAVVSEPRDLMRKVKKAMQVKGPSYLQILVPCVPGWGIDTNLSLEIARLAMRTCLFPVFEMVEGEVVAVKQVKEKDHQPVEEYLRPQKRFAHLFQAGGGTVAGRSRPSPMPTPPASASSNPKKGMTLYNLA